MAHEAADVSAYDPAIMDKDKSYFSTKLITTGIMYNTNAPMKPTSYKDLLKPEAKNKLAMPSPLTSGAATIHMTALTSNPELGWAYYEGLADQGANPQGGNGGVYKAIAGGEKLYGFVVDSRARPDQAHGFRSGQGPGTGPGRQDEILRNLRRVRPTPPFDNGQRGGSLAAFFRSPVIPDKCSFAHADPESRHQHEQSEYCSVWNLAAPKERNMSGFRIIARLRLTCPE